MKNIILAPGTSIDLDSDEVKADGFRMWLAGESGSGKSCTAMLVASQWLQHGYQLIVLDAHGEYGALWEARPRDVMRFGYGGPQLRNESVDWCMDYVKEEKSLLLDLSHWTDLYPEELSAFALKFLKDLYEYRRKVPKRTLVLVEEAQSLVPEAKSKSEYPTVRLFTAMANGGRKFGLNFLLSSQRQSLVDINIISACNVRVFMRISEMQDWRKVRGYLPKGFPVSFGGKLSRDIKKFKSGEAITVSRWLPTKRVQLALPDVGVKKFL